MDYEDDPIRTTVLGAPLPRTTWALVRDGVIRALVQTYDHLRHPFEDADTADQGVPRTGSVGLRVTGIDVAVGHLVDHHGNVTPAEGRTGPLPAGEPAYHDGPARETEPATTAEEKPTQTAEPEPAPELPPDDRPAGE